jgi:hypothetical protein
MPAIDLSGQTGETLEQFNRRVGYVPAGAGGDPYAIPDDDELDPPQPLYQDLPEEPEEPEEEPDSAGALVTGGRMLGTAVERASQLTGGGVQVLADVTDAGLGMLGVGDETVKQFRGGEDLVINWLRNLDIVDDPDTGLDYLMRAEGPLDAIRRGGVAGVGALVTSIPDMIGATGSKAKFGAYLTGVLGDTAKARAQNRTKDPEAEPTMEDYGIATLALPAALLERIGGGLLLRNLDPGLSKGVADALAEIGETTLGKVIKGQGLGARVAKGGLATAPAEGLLELPQSALEYLGATYGTDAFSLDELKRQSLEGGALGFLAGAVGGGAGGGLRGPAAAKGGPSATGLLDEEDEADTATPAAPAPPKSVGPDVAAALEAVDRRYKQPAQREAFLQEEIDPAIRAVPTLGPEPEGPETGTTADPRQLALPGVTPAQGALGFTERQMGSEGPREGPRLLPTTLLPADSSLVTGTARETDPDTAAQMKGNGFLPGLPTAPSPTGSPVRVPIQGGRGTTTVATTGMDLGLQTQPGVSIPINRGRLDPRPAPGPSTEGTLLDPAVAEAIARRSPQIEAFNPEQMAGPAVTMPQMRQAMMEQRPQPAPSPLAETGTTPDPAQRSFMNGQGPGLDPGLLGNIARRNMARRAASGAPAGIPSPASAPAAPDQGPGAVPTDIPGDDQLGPPQPLLPGAAAANVPAAEVVIPPPAGAATPAAAPVPVATEPVAAQPVGAVPGPLVARFQSAQRQAPAPAPPAPEPTGGAPQIQIGQPARGGMLMLPSRRALVQAAADIARQSNEPGANLSALRQGLAQLEVRAADAGVNLADVERAAGIEPGGIQSQLDAVEAFGERPAEEAAAGIPKARGRRKKGVAGIEQVESSAETGNVVRKSLAQTKTWSPDIDKTSEIGGQTVYAPNSVNADLNRLANGGGSFRGFRALANFLLRANLTTRIELAEPGSLRDGRAAEYDVDNDVIRMDPELRGWQWDLALLHEAVHAATARLIRADPKLQKQLDDIRKQIADQAEPDEAEALGNALTSNDELLTLALTDSKVQEVLGGIGIARPLAPAMGRIANWVRKVLGLKPKDGEILSKLILLGEDTINRQAALVAGQQDTGVVPFPVVLQQVTDMATGYSVDAFMGPQAEGQLGVAISLEQRADSTKALRVRLPENIPSVDGATLARLAQDQGVPRELVRDFIRDAVFANFDAVRYGDQIIVAPHAVRVLWGKPPALIGKGESLGLERKRLLAIDSTADSLMAGKGADLLGSMWDRKLAKTQTIGHALATGATFFQPINQIVEWYGGKFGGRTSADNPLVEYVEALDKRRAIEGRLRERGQKIIQQHNNLSEDDAKALGELAIYTTMNGVDPNSTTAPVEVLETDTLRQQAEKGRIIRAHARARKAFLKQPQVVQDVYNQSRDFYRDSFRQRRVLVVSRLLAARGADVAGFSADTPLGDVIERLNAARPSKGRKLTKAESNIRSLIRAMYQEKPVYFPLRRHGRYFTSVENKDEVTYASREEALADREKFDDPTLVTWRIVKAASKSELKKGGDPSVTVVFTHRDVAFHGSVQEGERYVAQLKRDNPEFKDAVIGPVLKRDFSQGGKGIPVERLVANLNDKLAGSSPESRRDAIDAVLAMMPELSSWKARMRRKNIPGVRPEEFRQSSAREIKVLARQEALLTYARTMAEILQKAQRKTDEARKEGRFNDASLMTIAVNRLSSLASKEQAKGPPGALEDTFNRYVGMMGFTGFLARPAFALINMSQNWINAYPVLGSRYGYVATTRAMQQAGSVMGRYPLIGRALFKSALGTKAILTAAGGVFGVQIGKPDEKLRDLATTLRERIEAGKDVPFKDEMLVEDTGLYDQLVERGRAAETQTLELLNTARSGGGFSRSIDDAMEIAREMANTAEVTNRVVTGMATYMMERQRGTPVDAAIQAAVDTIDQLHFNYDSDYRSAAFRYLPRAMTQFKDYAIGTLNLFVGEAVRAWNNKYPGDRARGIKALAGMALAVSSMGGVMGLAFAEPLKWLWYIVAAAMGEEEDPQDQARKFLRDTVSEMGGSPWLGEYVVGGLPRALGIDLSGSVGLQNLLFGTVRGNDPEERFWGLVGQTLAGPVVGALGVNAFKFAEDPNWANALAMPFIPKSVSDLYKAYELTSTGLTDQSGDVLMSDPTWREYVPMALGFKPASISRLQEKRGAFYRAKATQEDRRNSLIQDYRNARTDRERQDVIEDIQLFNQTRPTEPIRRRTLVNSVKQKRERERRIRQTGGVDLTRKDLPLLLKSVGVMPD